MIKPPSHAPVYATLFPILAEISHEHGYALTVHGSLHRDLDLLAVPWTDDAVAAAVLFEALKNGILAYTTEEVKGPTLKPHGRLAMGMLLDGIFLDLGIMPRKQDWESLS